MDRITDPSGLTLIVEAEDHPLMAVHSNQRTVRRIEGEEKTAGGLLIPETAKEKPQEGEVVSVGSGARKEDGGIVPCDVKAGDRILFGKWSGTEVKIDGEELLIMKESDIMGVLNT